MEAPDDLGAYVRRILGVPYWRLRLLVIADCWRGDLSRYPYVSDQAAPTIILSVRAMSAGDGGGAVASALLFGWQTPFVFWVLPQLLCQPFLRAYVLAEHTGCTTDRNGLTNTRTTLTNAARAAADVEHAVSTPSTICIRRSRSIAFPMRTRRSVTGWDLFSVAMFDGTSV